jgi:tRNA modification GTPase
MTENNKNTADRQPSTVNHQPETIVALATPPGVGAIAVIRLSGPEAINIINDVFPAKDLTQEASHTIHLGTIRDDRNQVLDEVLISLFKTPTSYTRENVIEVSCHGSNYIIQSLIQLFLRKGARTANPGEFTMRAFLNGQMDLSQAEAVADLIASNSESSHSLAMSQMRGGFSDEIKNLRTQLIDFASLIELELDFGEEDVEFANRDDLKQLIFKIQRLLTNLIDSFKLGNVLKNGVNTVIAGRPNAGKSTLLNALLNEERAIVSDIAGTTRDTIEEVLNINGITFRLIDTAGIRDAQDTIEAVGVEKTFEKIKSSSILVYVYDAAAMSVEEVQGDLRKLQKEDVPVLLIANKSDALTSAPPNPLQGELSSGLSEEEFLAVSAAGKEGIEEVKEKLHGLVLSGNLNLDQTIVTNARHYDSLRKADATLNTVLFGMDSGVTSDFIAMDIRQSLHYLGEITGEISTDDLLGNIFSNFCIGK